MDIYKKYDKFYFNKNYFIISGKKSNTVIKKTGSRKLRIMPNIKINFNKIENIDRKYFDELLNSFYGE
jgi:hypothetical protein